MKKTTPLSTFLLSMKVSSYCIKIQIFMLKILPFCLFFSYYPKITLANTDTMNLELSLPLCWLVIFSLLSVSSILKTFQNIFHPSKHKFNLPLLLSLSFPLYSSLSILWSKNQLRAILTSGIIWCIYASLLTFSKIILLNKNQLGKQIQKNIILSGVIFSVFCWLQSILDVAGIPSDKTFLCVGCTSQVFGFPHPNGFAIEPQFMGNLLLAPIFLSLFYFLEDNQKREQLFSSVIFLKKYLTPKLSRSICFLTTFFLIVTLHLTFSRGAIFSFWVGLFLLFILKIIPIFKKHQKTRSNIKQKNTLQTNSGVKDIKDKKQYLFYTLSQFFCIAFFPFILSLFSQGVFTVLGPTDHTFLDGISTSINHLSLGYFNLNFLKSNQTPSNDIYQASISSEASLQKNTPDFSGYIKESTSIRLNLNKLALSSLQKSISRLFLGVGLGGTGISLYRDFPELGSPKEIIQNEYIAILYELGLIGLLLAITTIMSLTIYLLYNKSIKKASKSSKTLSLIPLRSNLASFFTGPTPLYPHYIFTLVIIYCITLCFFSGLPNVLHIYLLPASLIGLSD